MAKLQTDSVRDSSRLTKNDAQIGGSLELGRFRETAATDAYLKLPMMTTTQRNALTAEQAMVVYDTTLGKEMTYRAGGWGAGDGTAAGSLDAGYNGGNEITVDSSAVTLTDSLTDTTGTLLITKGGAVTGADSADVLFVNSTGAHDTSGRVALLRLLMGTEAATSPIGAYITMNANTDSAITITKGAVTLADGAMTLTSGNFTMSAGNADITGTLTVSDVAALEEITASGAYTGQGVMILDLDNAEAFLIRENGDAANVLTVDTTQDAGDTTMLLTTKVTTGTGFHLDGSTITTGDAFKVTVAAAVMGAAGAAISVVADGTEVFAVRDDGTMYSKATAEGTTGFELATGDAVITDGDLIVSAGEVAFTSKANAAGLVIVNNIITTAKGIAVTMDAITTGDMLYLDAGGGTLTAGSGFYINCNDDNVSDFTVSKYGATTIKGTAAGTAALTMTTGDLVITDTDTTTITSVNGVGNTVEIISGGAVGAGKGTLTIDQAGVLNATGALLRLEADGVTATNSPYAMQVNAAGVDVGFCKVDSDGATDSVMHIHGGGAIANNQALLELTWDGIPANAGSNMLRVDGSGGTNTVKPVLVEIFDDSVSTCLSLSSAPTANSVALFTGTGALTNGYAVLHVTSSGALATGGNTFKVSTTGAPASGAIYAEYDFTGITDTHENIGLKIDAGGKKVIGLHVDADPEANSVAYITAGAALAADKAVLEVVSVPTTNNADSSVLRLEQTHTAGAAGIVTMVQGDVSEPFIKFESTAGAGSAINTDATSGATTHHVLMELVGIGDVWVACSTNAPS